VDEAGRGEVRQHDLHALVGGRLEGAGGGRRVDRDADDDAGLLRQHGLDVGDLLLGLEAGVGDRDDLDAHGGELGLQGLDLGPRPVVAAVVHDDRRGGVHPLDLGELLVAQLDHRDRLRGHAVHVLDQNRVRQLGQRRGGVGGPGAAGAEPGGETEQGGGAEKVPAVHDGVAPGPRPGTSRPRWRGDT
jgi:hypothetical protein